MSQTIDGDTGEILPAATIVEVQERAANEAAVDIAKRHPRDMTKFTDELRSWATSTQQVADACFFVVPRGSEKIVGPSIRFAEASFDSVNGRFEVRWSIDTENFELQVVIPCNCTALVIMPDAVEHEVVAGMHLFTMAIGEAGDGIPVLREVSGG